MGERNYQDRSILILGGSGGIGLKAVAEFAREGVTVYVGTSSLESFNRAVQHLTTREKLAVDNLPIFAFPADVTDKKQIEFAAKGIKGLGIGVTDVIFSQAGGMEGFTRRLFTDHIDRLMQYGYRTTPIERLNEVKKAAVEEQLVKMRADLQTWTEEVLPQAVAVNYQGTFDVLDVLYDVFPKGFRGVFYNSTWGDLSGVPGVEIPLLYRPVNRSKAMVRDRLKEEGQILRAQGIPMGVVIASLVNDTAVGRMFNDFFLNLMDADQREAVRSSSIQRQDVVDATRMLLDSDPNTWPDYPYNLYVYKKDGAVIMDKSLEEMSAMYTIPYRF